VLAAFIPLFVTSPDSRWVEVFVGIASWVVFLVDLVVQQRIVPRYLHTRQGKFDLAIVLVTFPYYLIPGISGGSAILLLARLGRAARVLIATSGLRRFGARLGKGRGDRRVRGDDRIARCLRSRARYEPGLRDVRRRALVGDNDPAARLRHAQRAAGPGAKADFDYGVVRMSAPPEYWAICAG
jgi:hypothetical protein